MKTSRSFATLLAMVLVVGGCSTHNQSSQESLSPVIGADVSVTSIPASSLPAGEAAEAADVEGAYSRYVACLEDAGFTGSIRFDLSRSASLVQDIDIGADPDAGQRLLDACLEPFDALLTVYQQTHPQTVAQSDAIRDRFLACGDSFFPGDIDSDGSYDDVLLRYNELAVASDRISEALECADDAMAGPEQRFGS